MLGWVFVSVVSLAPVDPPLRDQVRPPKFFDVTSFVVLSRSRHIHTFAIQLAMAPGSRHRRGPRRGVHVLL